MLRAWVCSQCLSRGWRLHALGRVRLQSGLHSNSSSTIYPALLSRARDKAAELKALTAQLEQDYDVGTAKKAGELSQIAEALGKWDKANEALRELGEIIRDPQADGELKALATDDIETTMAQLQSASKTLTESLVPKDPFADLPCLIEIRPGAGGSEGGIFAKDLFEMYKAYCATQGLRCSVVEERNDDATSNAIAEVILAIDSPGAYGVLRCEAGVHRVQRVPETEKMGRTHTSAAAVMVLPSSNEETANDEDISNANSDFYVDPSEVRVEVMRSSGAGGQHVNRTESAVRLTHLPTSTTVSIQTGRSQLANRKAAWNLLRSRLAQSRREAREEEMLRLRRSVVGVAKLGRGDKIRTYNWAQQRITDHRSGVSVHGIDGVMGGGQNLEKLMESVRKWMVEREMEGLVTQAESHKGDKK